VDITGLIYNDTFHKTHTHTHTHTHYAHRFSNEHTGLKVPTEYDCVEAIERGPYQLGNDPLLNASEMGNTLGVDSSYRKVHHLTGYHRLVPSRWHDCHSLQSNIWSGIKWEVPSFPVVDE